MQSAAKTPDDYTTELPPERKIVIEKLRAILQDNLPEGFEEVMGYGMIGYVVPHRLYPPGYHCDPKTPLPFLGIASQKNFVALYHMGIYADKRLYEWFVSEYPKHARTKLDMGKSCIRFKKMDDIPFELLADLAKKMTVSDWTTFYTANLKR